MILRSMTFTAGSTTVTTTNTANMRAGWYIYAASVPVETTIASITDGTHFVITNNALSSATETVEATYATPGVYCERNQALQDIEDICRERGQLVLLELMTEAGVTRGAYGGIEQRTGATELVTYCYPVEFSPSIRRLEKAGLREECAAVVYAPMKTFITAGIEYSDINIYDGKKGIDVRRSYVYLQGEKYELREKSRVGIFADTYEYITMGVSKK